jgi:hypothetical protein
LLLNLLPIIIFQHPDLLRDMLNCYSLPQGSVVYTQIGYLTVLEVGKSK